MEARSLIQGKRRVLVKAGTGVLTDSTGCVSLGRLGHLVEQLSELRRAGKEVILVSSGAIAMGKQKLHEFRPSGTAEADRSKPHNPRACAAAGQSGLMALYDTLFRNKNLWCSQILLTDEDFLSEERRRNLRETIEELIALGAIPILNENDVISTRKTPYTDENNAIFWDNDSLSALVASETRVDVVILLTDVDGLYKEPPTEGRKGELIHTYRPRTEFRIGKLSRDGRGGMQAKIDAALYALSRGVFAVIVASGYRPNSILQIIAGKRVGTLFVANPERESNCAETIARETKRAQTILLRMSSAERTDLVRSLGQALLTRKHEILEANARDIERADKAGLAPSLKDRLHLSEAKLQTLAAGLGRIAEREEPIGQVLSSLELADGLHLHRVAVPLGVVLVVFEARPDVLPQVAGLALRSGNGLVLKGGKEAASSLHAIHRVLTETIASFTDRKLPKEILGLVDSREDVEELLQLDDVIDLVIPRGSGELVRWVSQNTKVPVLGHAHGICHVYVDDQADYATAEKVVIDSKTEYPAACNAAETLLLNQALVEDGRAGRIVEALKARHVTLYGGPSASAAFGLPLVDTFKKEYSNLSMTVEIVPDVDAAIAHINKFGSGHTDAIVTKNISAAQRFLRDVDSGCVFHNASTRFADGYRFGLGAEVGISTAKLHARGPVGLEGLMSTKWLLASRDGSAVSDFAQGKSFRHRLLLRGEGETLVPKL